MKKLNNQGYALLYVIGVVALVLFMVATLTNFTMQRAFHANRNIYKTKDQVAANSAVQAASMELILAFENENNFGYVRTLEDIILDFESDTPAALFNRIEEQYPVSIKRDTVLIKNSAKFTITSQVKDAIASRSFYLTNLPSFLRFALGSSTDLNLNGGLYIDGDVYAGRDIYMTNQMNYIFDEDMVDPDNDTLKTVIAGKVAMNSNRNIYLGHNFYNCSATNLEDEGYSCFILDQINKTFTRTNFNNVTESVMFKDAFLNDAPTSLTYDQRFLNVQLDATVDYYLKDAVANYSTLTATNPVNKIEEMVTKINETSDTNWVPMLGTHDELIYSTDTRINQSSILFESHLDITKDFNYEKFYGTNMNWVIINGDLNITNKQTKAITINANFIVKGKVKITGNVQMNSIIYTLDETLIDDATIRRLEDTTDGSSPNTLILMSKGKLQFSKINSYANGFTGLSRDVQQSQYTVTPDIEGFFYTDSNAEIYAVSSYIVIRGGIYSHSQITDEVISGTTDAYGLQINAFRGSVRNQFTTMDDDPYDISRSRMVIQHSQDILKSQPKGLPLNSEFNYLFEDITIK
jgi:hypothetical protein